MMPLALLETRRLMKSYPGTLALDGVSLRFEEGKVGAVIGKNGAGKSTLVKILSGAVRPTGGEVLLDGRLLDVRSPLDALDEGIATVYQELSLIPGLTVGENVLLGRFPRRAWPLRSAIDWGALRERAGGILRDMGMDLDVRQPVSHLSLARRQMLEIARAMSQGARVVLLDEPTAGLARAEVGTLFDLVRRLAGKGVAIVYVTHRLAELGEIADTVTALRDGRHAATIPVADATPERLVELMYGQAHSRPGPMDLYDGAAAAAEFPPEPAGARQASGEALGRAQPEEARLSPPQMPDPSAKASRQGAPGAPSDADCSEPLLEVRGLELEGALHDISLTLGRGEILGIAGMLGSGRTELLKCLFGALRADRGEIVVYMNPPGSFNDTSTSPTLPPPAGPGARTPKRASPGLPSSAKEEARQVRLAAHTLTPRRMKRVGVALVPEDRKLEGLILGLSTLDNACLASLRAVARYGVVSKRRQRDAVDRIVRDLDLAAADVEAPVSSLSGGNQQKVVIGKWLATHPRVILWDEPTRGMDVAAKEQVFEILRGLARRGIGSILVSSELEELIEACHRILVLRKGRIVAETPAAVLSLERLFALSLQG